MTKNDQCGKVNYVTKSAIEIIEGEIAIIEKNISLHIAPHSSAYAKNVLINMLNKIKGL